jgi:hypothetical protein
VSFVAFVIRGDLEGLADWIASCSETAGAVEMLASRHRAGPWLAQSLAGTGAWAALPAACRERLTRSADLQAAATRECMAHLRELDTTLARLDVPYVLLKGPELGARFFGSPLARGYRDLDLLVTEEHGDEVCVALERAGHWRLSRWLLGARASARFVHAVDYRHGGRLLDLHWCVSRVPGVRTRTTDLFSRADLLELDGMAVRVLSREDELSLLLISAFADIQRGYLRLQSLVDIAHVPAAPPDLAWVDFLRSRGPEGTRSMCEAVLALMAALFRGDGDAAAFGTDVSRLMAPREALAVLLPSPGGCAAKYWALRHLPVGPLHYAAWWTISLPFRLAASHPLFRRVHPDDR